MVRITNFDDYEKLLHHAFYNELRVAPEERPLVMSTSPDDSVAQLEKIMTIVFETFNVPEFISVPATTLALIAAKRTTGVSVLMGNTCVYVAPIHEASTIVQAVKKLPIGGAMMTNHLMKGLNDLGLSFVTTAERKMVKDIKERGAFVPLGDGSPEVPEDFIYQQPDGLLISIPNRLLAQIGEVYFDPNTVLGSEQNRISLVDAIRSAIEESPTEIQAELWNNIVVSGGCAALPNLEQRLQRELEAARPQAPEATNTGVQVFVNPLCKSSVFIGGSIVGKNPDRFRFARCTMVEYDESGPSLALSKHNL